MEDPQSSSGSSVYDLVTKLCEKFAILGGKKPSKRYVRALRSRTYEILLSKRLPHTGVEILEDNSDPLCHLLAWQFVLINQYKNSEQADKIQKCVDSLQKSLPVDDPVLTGILYILLQLRKPPDANGGMTVAAFATSAGSCLKFRKFDEFTFSLNAPTICSDSKFNNSSFHLRRKLKRPSSGNLGEIIDDRWESDLPRCTACLSTASRMSCLSALTRTVAAKDDEGYESPSNARADDTDIWDLVSNSVYTEHRTWESIGNPSPEQEPPFATEAPSALCADLLDLQKPSVSCFFGGAGALLRSPSSLPSLRTVSQSTFVKHVKFLLVGMTSDSFKLDRNGEFQLDAGISIEGITWAAVETFTRDFIFCGCCYRALNNLCNMSIHCYGNQHKGFIFKEFCESIKRYLSYYRVATLSVSENSNLLSVGKHVRPLQYHLDCLASICKVGPFSESEQLPSGVALLNYLYQKLTSLTRKDVIMVLYSILYPCIQVYFSRFLQQWIFEGIVDDPYNEFFIHKSHKLANSRLRCYWTRCFTVQEDIVPDFLMELSQDILYCGRAMNLLKLCAPNSPLCLYLMGKKPALLSCCLNSEQTVILEQKSACYYLEVVAECGPKFSVEGILTKSYEEKIIFMNLITKKRAVTLRRLELEKLKMAQQELDRKRASAAMLKQQYDQAMQDKKAHIIKEISREMKSNESLLKIHSLRRKLIEEEAFKLVEYYNKLSEVSEQKRISIERHIDRLKKVDLDPSHAVELEPEPEPGILMSIHSSSTFVSAVELANVEKQERGGYSDNREENKVEICTSTDSSFHSIGSDTAPRKSRETVEEMYEPCVCLDVLNANLVPEVSDLTKIVMENKEAAKRNKAKVMSAEMGVVDRLESNEAIAVMNEKAELTDLQKNRLRVLSSEFDILVNGNANLPKSVGDKRFYERVDNETFLDNNKNFGARTAEENGNAEILLDNDFGRKLTDGLALRLDFSNLGICEPKQDFSIFGRFLKSPNFELERPIPMSVDSTPCTEISNVLQQSISTAASCLTEECFNFQKEIRTAPASGILENAILTKRVTLEDAANVSTDCLKLFIQQSVMIPVKTQTKLVNDELLKYFFVELQYLTHLNSLRSYFFLLDGEFGRNITEGLFDKLYDVNFPVDLINCRTLQRLVYNAMESSIRLQENASCLSFKINALPKTFDLGNPDVLDCLSLTYKVSWPLNILLSSDTVSKYDDVFKFLLKLHRVSWVLKKILQDLKLLSKRSGIREPFLILSPQFNRLHHCRHVMTHFVQTLQNYVIGGVLQPSWNTFEKKLALIDNLYDLYNLHTSYIKNILFMCLLNKRFGPIRKVIQNIFAVILKFYNYMSARDWQFDEEDGAFVHPNFRRLDDIFANFEEIVIYLFKAGNKLARVGYQPHLVQLLDMLNINEYYSRKTDSQQSISVSV